MRLAAWLLALATVVYAQTDLPAGAPKDMDLFLLIGQSNMAGRGAAEAQDREAMPHVFSLNKEMKWVPAMDPLHFDKPDIAGVGLGRSFAKVLLAQKPGASIGLIPAAFGGTSLDEWKPDGKLYTDAVKRAREAMKSGRLRGILWHQGEADSEKEEWARSYRERFAAMVARLRSDLGAEDVPLVIGQLGEFFVRPFSPVVNEQLAMAPLTVPRCLFVGSGGLKDKGDKTHFDTPSVREFGRRYAQAFLLLDPTWAK
jgi:hypothetical protein